MRLPDPARSRAVLLGTSTFTDTALPDLPAVRNNLADLAEVLTSEWATGISRANCVVLPDEFDTAVIGGALRTAAAQAEDMLLIYYAGHGLIGEDGSLYLSLPQTCSDPEMVSWTALPYQLLRSRLANARADNRVVILDCCFSGLAIDLMTDVTSAVSGQLTIAGTCTLASSPAHRPSIAPSSARHTAYTGELLELLRRGPRGDAELLTLTAIHEHLSKVLPSRGFPRPEQRNTHTVGRLALARRRVFNTPTNRLSTAPHQDEAQVPLSNAPVGWLRMPDSPAAPAPPRWADVPGNATPTTDSNPALSQAVEILGGPEPVAWWRKLIPGFGGQPTMDVLQQLHQERDRVLRDGVTREQIQTVITDVVAMKVDMATAVGYVEDWDLDALWARLTVLYPARARHQDLTSGGADVSREELLEALLDDVHDAYNRRESEIDSLAGAGSMRNLERQVLLALLDRSIAQGDTSVDVLNGVKEDLVGYLFNLQVEVQAPS
ncbi:caspase family protein [Nocardia barduliensis]|uniref:caspase family protein n=1 Tax=Nocardia barduliensis TaxID=2736643 RepID=UPI001C2D576E|nr:caspase family protein [Nocardia barduliensis]